MRLYRLGDDFLRKACVRYELSVDYLTTFSLHRRMSLRFTPNSLSDILSNTCIFSTMILIFRMSVVVFQASYRLLGPPKQEPVPSGECGRPVRWCLVM